jgi:hypothetical protein
LKAACFFNRRSCQFTLYQASFSFPSLRASSLVRPILLSSKKMQRTKALSSAARSVSQAQSRLFSSSSSSAYALPPKYGSGPLYRSKLTPKDAITHADAPVLRMLMVCTFDFSFTLVLYPTLLTFDPDEFSNFPVWQAWFGQGHTLCQTHHEI